MSQTELAALNSEISQARSIADVTRIARSKGTRAMRELRGVCGTPGQVAIATLMLDLGLLK